MHIGSKFIYLCVFLVFFYVFGSKFVRERGGGVVGVGSWSGMSWGGCILGQN